MTVFMNVISTFVSTFILVKTHFLLSHAHKFEYINKTQTGLSVHECKKTDFSKTV